MIGFILVATTGKVGLTQNGFYDNVTNLWYQGGENKTNVLTIANERLRANTNDFAGLLLRAHYNAEFLEIGAISNDFLRLIQVGDRIVTTNFVESWQGRSEYIMWFLDFLAETPLTPQEIQAEKHKALIPNKPFPDVDLLEALRKDGFFN